MPLLHPQIDPAARDILSQSGLIPSANDAASKMSNRLDAVGLSRDDLAFELKLLVSGAQTEQTKLAATKLALEIHGELKSQEQGGAVNINIIGADAETLAILIPR